LSLDTGRMLDADAVVLALGNAAPASPPVFLAAGAPLLDPWDDKTLRRIPAGDVLLLGTGLTAVDAALSLARTRRMGVIYALSRRGQLPQPHRETVTPLTPLSLDLPLPLSEALLVLRKEAQAAASRGEPWQHVVDQLRARTPELWRRLPTESKQRFLRHLRPWWDSHRHRMAPEIAAQISALRRAGRLCVLVGDTTHVEAAGKTTRVRYRERGSAVSHHLEVAGVVNCTGAAMDLSVSGDPLIRQVFEDGIVRAPEAGIGMEVDEGGRVRRADGAVWNNLFALGPITQGVFWESTAVPEVRAQAEALAVRLVPDR